ncbi:hypothetical protein ACT3CE_06270 [Marinifilum sp. RC60d5]|uniref:hypothetical protein n=1 Tax=Marinifilum sp. RC60d5 TaxID=3458414 RepID=UPI004035791E
MSEQQKKEQHKKLISDLQSNDIKIVAKSISQLREEGKLEDLEIVFDLLLNQPNEEIKDILLKFLGDIKDKKAALTFVNAIKNEKYLPIRKMLIEVCWQSSIDFSPFADVFVDILIQSDFEIAFEAFTVIENFTGKIEEDFKILQQDKLKDAIPTAAEEVKGMIHECIHILDQF